MNTILHIKNMVCNRCIRVVREDLEELGFNVQFIELGKVTIEEVLSADQLESVDQKLTSSGFQILSDQQSKLIEQVKTFVIEHVFHGKMKPEHQNFSEYLAQQIGVNYFSLSKLFSSAEGMTIEKYIILQKIERVKELLIYGEQNLSEIAYDVGYSTVSHLSGQFKKVTGMTPTTFRKLTKPRRNSIDQVGKSK